MHNSQDRPGTIGAGERLVVIKHSPFNAETPPAALESEITPTANFYVRSNFAVPVLDLEGWRLRVGGMVDAAFEIDLTDLAGMEARELTTSTAYSSQTTYAT